jgi:transposase
VACRDCGVRVEAVPWARPGARHSRDFEDLTAFCAQQMAKSQVQSLLRVAWDTVGRIVERVGADHLDERRLAGLVRVGCDELSYRGGQRYLSTVADHASGRIVWSSPGRNAQTLQAFFDELGERKESIKAISIDMSGGYEKAIRAALPDAQIAFDPFHVVALAGRAVDDVRRAE